MRIPVDTTKVSFIAIGTPSEVLDFETKTHKADAKGTPLYRVPVVLFGTGEYVDPTVNITIASASLPAIKSGDALVAAGLVANFWTMPDRTGRGQRSGVSFRADKIEVSRKPQ
jgi:hypothetical protein